MRLATHHTVLSLITQICHSSHRSATYHTDLSLITQICQPHTHLPLITQFCHSSHRSVTHHIDLSLITQTCLSSHRPVTQHNCWHPLLMSSLKNSHFRWCLGSSKVFYPFVLIPASAKLQCWMMTWLQPNIVLYRCELQYRPCTPRWSCRRE